MEFFQKGRSVILCSHLHKYLVAEDDGEMVRQSRNGSSNKARWRLEFVEGKIDVVRLKSCHGRYLSASEMQSPLGITGKTVIQSENSSKRDTLIEWKPQREGFQVKLRSWSGTYLRANGGPPPWRNSVTHDIPQAPATQNWILWDIEVVENIETESLAGYDSQLSSFSSSASDDFLVDESEPNSPLSIPPQKSPKFSFPNLKPPKFSLPKPPKPPKPPKFFLTASEKNEDSFTFKSGMELFRHAQVVRLRSHHEKYLLADEDEESVCQERNGSSKTAKWTVEFLQDPNFIRLKSCYGKYLTASNAHYLLGMTGHKVLQTLPAGLDSSVEWEPIREGFQAKLRSRDGTFLRANGGPPPWRNSITHDKPHMNHTKEWLLWDVDILDIYVDSPTCPLPPVKFQQSSPTSPARSSSSPSPVNYSVPASPKFSRKEVSVPVSPKFSRKESSDSLHKPDGRTIYYSIADAYGNFEDDDEGSSLIFKGTRVDELTQRLEKETGIQGIIVCSRSVLDDKLYPLRLHLPPNNNTMHVVLIQASTKAARDLKRQGTPL